MRLPRRKILQLAAGSAAFSAMARIVRAETCPARPVHINASAWRKHAGYWEKQAAASEESKDLLGE